MKNLAVYYCLILLPLVYLVMLAFTAESNNFAWALLVYALIYRPVIDGYKLMHKGIIKRNRLWVIYLPSTYRAYFNELYFS